MRIQYRVPKDLIKKLNLETGKVVQCTSATINEILNGSTMTEEATEGTTPLWVDLMIRSDKKDNLVLFENSKCVQSAIVELQNEQEGYFGYFALMNTLKGMFLKVLKSHVDINEYVRNTMMLPIGYLITDKGRMSIVFHLIVKDDYMTSDYVGNITNTICKLNEASRNMILGYHPDHEIFLNTMVKLEK